MPADLSSIINKIEQLNKEQKAKLFESLKKHEALFQEK